MIITYGWYANNWWMEPATSDQYNCTAYERASVLLYTLAPVIREYPVDLNAPAEPDNIVRALIECVIEANYLLKPLRHMCVYYISMLANNTCVAIIKNTVGKT